MQRYTFSLIGDGQKSTPQANDRIVGWQADPTIRGTWAILWSCSATLILCVYTVMHLQVPYRTGTWRIIVRQLSWIIIGLCFPEGILYLAWQEWCYARYLSKRVVDLCQQRKACGQEVPEFMTNWTMTHSFFINMGGVAIARAETERSKKNFLTPDGLLQMLLEREDTSLSVLTKESIEDRSKSDPVTKTLTILQASHTIVLVIIRLVNKQAVSALEVTTCAYVILAVIFMIFWWHKPYNVRDPIVLSPQHSLIHQQDEHHFDRHIHDEWSSPGVPIYTTTIVSLSSDIGHSALEAKHLHWSYMFIFIGSSIGASLHLYLWSAHFPTPAERLIWRISSVLIAAVSLVFGLCSVLALFSHYEVRRQPVERDAALPDPFQVPTKPRRRGTYLETLSLAFGYVLDWLVFSENGSAPNAWCWFRNRIYLCCYVAARGYIIIESFIGLRSLPADVYLVPAWTSIIPNFG